MLSDLFVDDDSLRLSGANRSTGTPDYLDGLNAFLAKQSPMSDADIDSMWAHEQEAREAEQALHAQAFDRLPAA